MQPAKFDGGLLRLNVTFKEAKGLLDCVPELLIKAPFFVRLPATSYAGAVASASATMHAPDVVKVTVALTESSWLCEVLQQLYTHVRIYPGATLTPTVIRIVLNLYNKIVPGGPVFESLEANSWSMLDADWLPQEHTPFLTITVEPQ
jgi:hypothetical protein